MKILFYITLFFVLSTSAQKKYVIKYRGNPQSDLNVSNSKNYFELKKIAFLITNDKIGEQQKVEAVYLWISKNISYDHELRFSKKLQKDYYNSKDKIISKVLERKKALCGGYALLFERLCKGAGIEAKTIHGFTKLASSYHQPNHSWNAVRINGKWQLLDITWSISNGHPHQPDKNWFLTNPAIFIKSHFPQDSKWALLKNTPSLVDFRS